MSLSEAGPCFFASCAFAKAGLLAVDRAWGDQGVLATDLPVLLEWMKVPAVVVVDSPVAGQARAACPHRAGRPVGHRLLVGWTAVWTGAVRRPVVIMGATEVTDPCLQEVACSAGSAGVFSKGLQTKEKSRKEIKRLKGL